MLLFFIMKASLSFFSHAFSSFHHSSLHLLFLVEEEIKLNTLNICHEEFADWIVKIFMEVMRAVKRTKKEK